MRRNLPGSGDIVGGFSGAAVALPQAIGLGVVLFTAMGQSASSGALAGLLGAIVLQLIVGGVSATTGIISAPNGPMTMLLVGVMESMAAQGSDSETMLLTLSAVLIATGIFQIVFAAAGGTSIIKYIPYPVIAGLVAGVGILMVKSQWSMLAESWNDAVLPGSLKEGFGLLVALATILSMLLIPRLSGKRIPAAPAGLAAGIAVYFLFLFLLPVEAESSWVVGEIPSVESLHFGFDISKAASLPIKTVVAAALALTVLGTVDSLVTSLVADSKTGMRHNSKKEIMAQGISGITVGMLGGLGGWGTKGATIVSTEAGGRRWAPVIAGIFFLILLLFAGKVGSYLPVSVLAGIVAMVGYNMIDWNILRWLKQNTTRQDGLVAIIVVATTLAASLVLAVAVGVILSAVLFIYKDAIRPVIHGRTTGKERRSNCGYPMEAAEFLEKYGEEIVMYELRGDLFFGTAERVRNTLETELERVKSLILHLRRVSYIDMSAMITMLQITEEAEKHGCEVVFCHLHEGLGFGRKVKRAFEQIDSRYSFHNPVFPDSDSAFEYAEKRLLKRHGFDMPADKTVDIAENNLCSVLDDEQIELLESIGHKKFCEKGDYVFRRGEEDECLYLVISGEIELRLPVGEVSYKRVVKFEAGSYFGEMGFVHPSEREADAIAVYSSELFVIPRSSLDGLSKHELSSLSLALLHRFSKDMSDTIKFAAREIRRLEEW